VDRLIKLLKDIGLVLGILAITVGVIQVHTHSAYVGVNQASRITGHS